MTNSQKIEALKADEAYFAAGAMAHAYGMGPAYGCHYGLRSTRDAAVRAFDAGYRAAERFAAEKAR